MKTIEDLRRLVNHFNDIGGMDWPMDEPFKKFLNEWIDNDWKPEDADAMFARAERRACQRFVEKRMKFKTSHELSYRMDPSSFRHMVDGFKAEAEDAQLVEIEERIKKCALDNLDMPIEMIRELFISNWKDCSDATPFEPEEDAQSVGIVEPE